jgi:glycerol-3-phosphate acyltransferase PlsY
VDLRDVGSGTVSGTALFEVAGFGPLAAAGVLEVAKGSVGPLLAGRERPWLAAAAGGLAVAGHDWSPWLRGAGGRGLSPILGALLVQEPRGAALLLSAMAGGRIVRQSGVLTLAASVALVPLLGRRRGASGAGAATALVAPMVLKRLVGNAPAPDRRALLSRLLLDRDRA